MFNVSIYIVDAILCFVEEVYVNIFTQMCIFYDTFVNNSQGLWLHYLLFVDDSSLQFHRFIF
jgi:hypothetical protein